MKKKLSNTKTAIKQRRYYWNDKAGLKYFEGLGYVEPGLVQHVLSAVTGELPMSVGVHPKDTLQRVLKKHLRYEWVEPWRPEWLACGGESAPQMPQPCADHP